MAYTVLIADDEKEIRSVLRLYLENAGYRVLEAADGIEAESNLVICQEAIKKEK